VDVTSEGSVPLDRPVAADGRRGRVGGLVAASQERVERGHVSGVGTDGGPAHVDPGGVDEADVGRNVEADAGARADFGPGVNVTNSEIGEEIAYKIAVNSRS
jgi:hypothetical protein